MMIKKTLRFSALSSSGNEVRRSKRLKTDTSNPSSLNSSDNDPVPEVDHLKRKLLIKLSRFDAAVVQSHEVSTQIQKLLEDRESLLTMKMEMDEQTIKQLRNELEALIKSSHEAQAAAESEISRMKKQNTELLLENARMKNRSIATHSRKTPLSNFQNNTPSNQAKRKSLEAEDSRVDELEKELQAARNTISSLGKAVKGKRRLEKNISDLQKKINNAENQRQHMDRLERKCEKLSLKVDKYLASGSQTAHDIEEEDVLINENDSLPHSNNLENPPPQVIEEIMNQECESDGKELEQWEEVRPGVYRLPNDDYAVRSGLYSFVRPSSRQFSELNWSEEFSHEIPGEWACKSCQVVLTRTSTIEDHVWAVHYGGHFECHKCSPGSTSFHSRDSVRSHNKMKHPELMSVSGSLDLTNP